MKNHKEEKDQEEEATYQLKQALSHLNQSLVAFSLSGHYCFILFQIGFGKT